MDKKISDPFIPAKTKEQKMKNNQVSSLSQSRVRVGATAVLALTILTAILWFAATIISAGNTKVITARKILIVDFFMVHLSI